MSNIAEQDEGESLLNHSKDSREVLTTRHGVSYYAPGSENVYFSSDEGSELNFDFEEVDGEVPFPEPEYDFFDSLDFGDDTPKASWIEKVLVVSAYVVATIGASLLFSLIMVFVFTVPPDISSTLNMFAGYIIGAFAVVHFQTTRTDFAGRYKSIRKNRVWHTKTNSS